MEEKEFYKCIADAIYRNETEKSFKGKGRTNITFEGEEYKIEYEVRELEGYEEPCYNIESPRCSPGGIYGLDTYVFESIWVTDTTDVDIDVRELSYIYNENDKGILQFEKRIWIDKYFDDNI